MAALITPVIGDEGILDNWDVVAAMSPQRYLPGVLIGIGLLRVSDSESHRGTGPAVLKSASTSETNHSPDLRSSW